MKRMIEFEKKDGKFFVRINSSSLEILQSCMRKAKYALKEGYRKEDEKESLTFGTAIHEALAHYYGVSKAERHDECRARCIEIFKHRLGSGSISDDTRFSQANGEKILHAYFAQYESDPFILLKRGESPLVEKSFEFELADSDTINIRWFGTIDAVFQNEETGEVLVVDHKTTWQLGAQFANRFNPNHQLTGYVLGARKCFDLNVHSAMINAIQVAKTKQEFLRLKIDQSDEMIEEFKDSVFWYVRQYLLAQAHDLWPMSAGSACAQYSGCQYLRVCQQPEILRKNVLSSFYPDVIPPQTQSKEIETHGQPCQP